MGVIAEKYGKFWNMFRNKCFGWNVLYIKRIISEFIKNIELWLFYELSSMNSFYVNSAKLTTLSVSMRWDLLNEVKQLFTMEHQFIPLWSNSNSGYRSWQRFYGKHWGSCYRLNNYGQVYNIWGIFFNFLLVVFFSNLIFSW